MYVRVHLRRLGCRVIDFCILRNFFRKILIVYISVQIQAAPVIHSCPLDISIRQMKPQRLNQMQAGARSYAGSPDISCIGWNLRFMKNNIKMCHRQLNFLSIAR